MRRFSMLPFLATLLLSLFGCDGTHDAPAPPSNGAACEDDEDCLATETCVGGVCVERAAPVALLLRLQVGDGEIHEAPESPVFVDVAEASGDLFFDASGTSANVDVEMEFAWRIADAGGLSGLTLAESTAPRASLSIPRVSFFDTPVQITLSVHAGEVVESAEILLTILNTINEAPVLTVTASAATVYPGESVTLQAAAYDPNGDDLKMPFAWVQLGGDLTVTLTDVSTRENTWGEVEFEAPAVAVPTTLRFQVSVKDDHDPPAEAVETVSVQVIPD